MPSLSESINIELANIDTVLNEMPSGQSLCRLSPLEVAGTATLLHNFYNGVENILKQIVGDQNVKLPAGQFWHQQLLAIAVKHKIVLPKTLDRLRPYLAFRHFFVHGYAFDLDAKRLKPLVDDVRVVNTLFRQNIARFYNLPEQP